MAKRTQFEEPVSLPRYVVSETEWAAVPRTVPDRLLRWGGSLPLLVLLFVGFKFPGLGLELNPDLEIFAVVALVFTVPLAVLAGRAAPWFSLLATGFLLAYGRHDFPMFCVLSWVLFYWFLALGMAAGFSSARFSRVIRHWRREAAGQVCVDGELLKSSRMHRRAIATLKAAFTAVVVLLAAKTVISLFTEAGGDIRALAGTVQLDDFESVVVPLVALGFWSIVVVIRLVQEKISGDVVLEIPLDPKIGPLVYQRAVQGVDSLEAQHEGCSCGGKKRTQQVDMPPMLEVDDLCRVHGIEAVNALSQGEFLDIADKPWVWGANAAQLPWPEHSKLTIVGLHGWGSRPVVVGTPAQLKDSETATHSGYRPWRAREVLNRTKRTIRWRDVNDSSIGLPATGLNDVEVLDGIELRAAGMQGHAVRIRGQRPRLEGSPVPLSKQNASRRDVGTRPAGNRYVPNREAMRASKP